MARRSIVPICLILVGLAGGFVAGPVLHGQNASVATAPQELTSYRNIVKQVLPAVVSIESRVKPKTKTTAQKGQDRKRTPFDDQVPEEFRRFFEEFQQQPFQMPEETPVQGFGSGFIVDSKGVILTNYHVVAGADSVEVTLQDGRTTFTSKDIHGDRKTDLAIVRIDPKGKKLPSLELGDSATMEIGDRVLAIGAPFGLTGTVTAGIVSAKGRNGLNVNMYEDFLQTDAAINPGNSGGPLVNLEGKVIGINAAIRSRTGGFQGVGLAIPSNMAKNVIGQLDPLHEGLGNVISGNARNGVEINGNGTVGNVVQSNFIGINDRGDRMLRNFNDGVLISAGAAGNIVGGRVVGAGNIISGNGSNGVEISGIGTAANLVQNNYIGTDPTGAVALGIEPVTADVRSVSDIQAAIAALGQRRDNGLVVMPETFTTTHRENIVALAAQHRVPAISAFLQFPKSGGLVSYGPDNVDIIRRSASYIDRILKGEKPAELPVQAATRYEVVINLKAARTLGHDVPPTVLARATRSLNNQISFAAPSGSQAWHARIRFSAISRASSMCCASNALDATGRAAITRNGRAGLTQGEFGDCLPLLVCPGAR